ncbi:hypothetical protein GW17_00023512 [Ensete ventricosum]|uniref:Uncharacterized protein n=1 Tax=Ensete ventricosum TaxID=4639 RepID=A0A426Y8N7_ENSVE|nr:hypothetical protein B296_00031184 [Ensete ventricosum]RWW12808.1 hypothetical protein GW17_00023512 [Ensete ventricosum]
MIRAVIVMNTQGKPRLLKFYEFQVPKISSVSLVRPRNLHSDPNANPLLTLAAFALLSKPSPRRNSRNSHGASSQMHTILDEIIFGGQVLETSSERVLKAVEEISRLEKSASSVSFVPKSVSGRFGR